MHPHLQKKREKSKTPIKSFLEFCCHFEDFIRMNICNPKEKVKSIRFFKVTWLFFSPNFSIFLITVVTVKIDTFESWHPAIDCKGLMLFLKINFNGNFKFFCLRYRKRNWISIDGTQVLWNLLHPTRKCHRVKKKLIKQEHNAMHFKKIRWSG